MFKLRPGQVMFAHTVSVSEECHAESGRCVRPTGVPAARGWEGRGGEGEESRRSSGIKLVGTRKEGAQGGTRAERGWDDTTLQLLFGGVLALAANSTNMSETV